jgi:hypothetical protein
MLCSSASVGFEQQLVALLDLTCCSSPLALMTCLLQDTLLAFGQLVVSEQENVRRVQLANEYLNSAALAGADGSSLPQEVW